MRDRLPPPSLRLAARTAVRHAAAWLRENAWRGLPSRLLDKWQERRFDRRHGTDTDRWAELRTLRIDSPNRRHGERYQPSPVRSLRQVLRRLDIDYASHTFVDIGCGRGRALLIAAELPFARVVGIDFSAELTACARRNIAAWRGTRRTEVVALQADATAFEWPPGDLVLYCFNPFGVAVLQQVLASVVASLREVPRRARLVYLYLPAPGVPEAAGFALRRAWRRYRVYEYDPAA